MSRTAKLEKLEAKLEAFLDEAIALKDERLGVLDGIDRLDEIARGFADGQDRTDEIGEWFADHNKWLREKKLKTADRTRIGRMLGSVRQEVSSYDHLSPALKKIMDEIGRWSDQVTVVDNKIVLTRGPEIAPPGPKPKVVERDTIAEFGQALERMQALYADYSGDKKHLLSTLNEALQSAEIQASKEALLLSASIIYFLKLNGYMVDPYLRRLKAAQEAQRQRERAHA